MLSTLSFVGAKVRLRLAPLYPFSGWVLLPLEKGQVVTRATFSSHFAPISVVNIGN